MKTILTTALILALAGSVSATPFSVGGEVLEIPSPEGFSLVTLKMDAVYRLSLQMADPVNDQLTYYIADSDASVARSGEMPPLEHTFVLKVNRKIKHMVVGSRDFGELKSMTKRQNSDIIKSVETQMRDLLEKTSKGIGKEFDVAFAMKLSQMVPLEPHCETDHAFAYSMYINYGAAVDGSTLDVVISATATFVNVAGKILFLYCYAPQEELEWTRSASETWAGMVMASNVRPPSDSSGGPGIDWSRVLNKGVVGAIIGGLMALVVGLFSRFKKKKG